MTTQSDQAAAAGGSTLETAEAREAFAAMVRDLDQVYTAFSILTNLAAAIRGADDEAALQGLRDVSRTLLPEEFSGVGDFQASVRGVNGDDMEFTWSIASVLRADKERGLAIINNLYQHFLLHAMETSMRSVQALAGFTELLQTEALRLGLVKLAAPRKPRGKKGEAGDDEGSGS